MGNDRGSFGRGRYRRAWRGSISKYIIGYFLLLITFQRFTRFAL